MLLQMRGERENLERREERTDIPHQLERPPALPLQPPLPPVCCLLPSTPPRPQSAQAALPHLHHHPPPLLLPPLIPWRARLTPQQSLPCRLPPPLHLAPLLLTSRTLPPLMRLPHTPTLSPFALSQPHSRSRRQKSPLSPAPKSLQGPDWTARIHAARPLVRRFSLTHPLPLPPAASEPQHSTHTHTRTYMHAHLNTQFV